jgi:hypothetical protein
MHGYFNLDAARRRQAEFRAEAAAGRLALLARALQVPARRRVARLIVAIGYVMIGAGHRLGSEEASGDRSRLRAVS